MSGAVPQLNRDEFKKILSLTALRVPTSSCQSMMKRFTGFTLDKPRLRCVVHDGDNKDKRLLLLGENVTISGLSEELQSFIACEGLEVLPYDLTLGYSYFSHDQVLKKLLPEGVEAPTSFECVGHIAHLNLREECLPYKYVIGQVILDKHQHLKTIVNKLGSIENEYRVFEMEVLAGEKRLETEVKQHNARFRLDFSKVYWNSRLETEHHRLVAKFQEGDEIADIMAGIGPFAIPAGQKGCKVYANDLNPSSVHWLRQNINLNKMQGQVLPFNLDGREFVRRLLGAPACTAETSSTDENSAAAAPSTTADAAQPAGASASTTSKTTNLAQRAAAPPGPIPYGFSVPNGGILFKHAVMNLPASAVEFLDAFNGAFDPLAWEGRELPLVHCYTFQKANETNADIIKKVEHYLGGSLEAEADIHVVRDVAPNKIMLCVSFRVPRAVAFAGRTDEGQVEDLGGLPNKKPKVG